MFGSQDRKCCKCAFCYLHFYLQGFFLIIWHTMQDRMGSTHPISTNSQRVHSWLICLKFGLVLGQYATTWLKKIILQIPQIIKHDPNGQGSPRISENGRPVEGDRWCLETEERDLWSHHIPLYMHIYLLYSTAFRNGMRLCQIYVTFSGQLAKIGPL